MGVSNHCRQKVALFGIGALAQKMARTHAGTRDSVRAASASASQLAKAAAAVKGAGMAPVAVAVKAVALAVWPLVALAVLCAAVDAARKAALSVEQVRDARAVAGACVRCGEVGLATGGAR